MARAIDTAASPVAAFGTYTDLRYALSVLFGDAQLRTLMPVVA